MQYCGQKVRCIFNLSLAVLTVGTGSLFIELAAGLLQGHDDSFTFCSHLIA